VLRKLLQKFPPGELSTNNLGNVSGSSVSFMNINNEILEMPEMILKLIYKSLRVI
jgi:hypothetical protein